MTKKTHEANLKRSRDKKAAGKKDGKKLPGKVIKSLDIDTKEGTLVEGEVEAKKTANSIRDIIKALSAAVDNEQITTRQARDMRMNLGIQQGYFTKKRISKPKRIATRKAQRAARKVNRGS